MTFEPGTADITTTMDPPFPGEEPQRAVLAAEYGWEIELIRVDDTHTQARLVHPWLGVLTSVVYRP